VVLKLGLVSCGATLVFFQKVQIAAEVHDNAVASVYELGPSYYEFGRVCRDLFVRVPSLTENTLLVG
jgi:hypothetical protein